jgi:hypothetical protein
MRRVGVLLAGTLLVTTVLAGCTSSRSSLGTTDNSCYLALPVSSRAVHGKGRLVGIQLYSESSLRKRAPNLSRDLSLSPKAQQKVCVAAYAGEFTRASVNQPLGQPSGQLAVVVSETPSNDLLGTVLFRHAPLHFGHPHVG